MPTSGYPESPAMLLASKVLGRPVRWLSTRQEGFLTDNQARDTIIEARLAMDTDGKFLALDIDTIAALGAYHTSHGAFIATVNFARCLPCMHDIPAVGLRIKCLFTNTVPTGPYRGAGRPEANYCLERLVDEAARITGIDRIAIRRRNLISAARMPYKTAVGTTYDSGNFAVVFDEALSSADVAGFAARQATSETAGKRRGLGVSCFLDIAGGQPGEGAAVAFPGSRKLPPAIGVQASGQGHRTVYRRPVAEFPGIPAERAKQLGDSLDAKSSFDAAPPFPNGVHVAEVEIDPATGRTTLAAYTCADDCGRVLQPVLVEGQVQGGVAQGVGQALLEWGRYDDASGQLLAGSFMDYAMPRAEDLPDIASGFRPVPCRTNPLGVKGVGEAGHTASLAAVMNAIADAIPGGAGACIDMPATADKVWRACRDGASADRGLGKKRA